MNHGTSKSLQKVQSSLSTSSSSCSSMRVLSSGLAKCSSTSAAKHERTHKRLQERGTGSWGTSWPYRTNQMPNNVVALTSNSESGALGPWPESFVPVKSTRNADSLGPASVDNYRSANQSLITLPPKSLERTLMASFSLNRDQKWYATHHTALSHSMAVPAPESSKHKQCPCKQTAS